jgi:Cytochrome P460
MMKSTLALILAAGIFAIACVFTVVTGQAHILNTSVDVPHYDSAGRLVLPDDYREWVFLSAGLDMNYSDSPPVEGRHIFGNVFVPRTAYRAFKKNGVWPDKTILILEDRMGATKGSINKTGQFQTDIAGIEAHVKDLSRFKDGWGFFAFDGTIPADLIDTNSSCYSCHLEHAAVDTTFVQFYPTLLPVAKKLNTLSSSYRLVAERDAGQ